MFFEAPKLIRDKEILTYLLQTLHSESTSESTSLVNHKNRSGNTPLHWAALNARLECVKALVAAGADISVKNHAGHDAGFLAERAAWTAGGNEQEGHQDGGDGKEEDRGEMSPGRAVVEWLLDCDKRANLESSTGDDERLTSAGNTGHSVDVS